MTTNRFLILPHPPPLCPARFSVFKINDFSCCCVQVSVFAPSSMQAAVALGASAEVLKSIGSAISARKAGNRSTFMAKPQFKAGSGSAAKSVSSGLPRVAGGVSGAVKLGRRLSGAVVAQQKDQHQPHATGRRASRLQDMSKTSGLVGSGSTPSNPLAVVAGELSCPGNTPCHTAKIRCTHSFHIYPT